MKKIQKFECCFDFFLDCKLISSRSNEVYKIRWNYLACVFLLILLLFPKRFFANFFIILVIESQTPFSNPLITRIRHLFLTYQITKKSLIKITWGAFGIFYFFHFHY